MVVTLQSVLQVIQCLLERQIDHGLDVEFLVVGWVGNSGVSGGLSLKVVAC